MYYMYMCVLVYSLLHICDSMAGHREGMRAGHKEGMCAGHREGMRTVQWLGTEKAYILYNGWAQRRHAYCTMTGHMQYTILHIICIM